MKKELVKDPEVVEDFEVEKERKAWENYYTRYRKREKEEMDRVEKTWWKNYDLYIDSPEWKEKRRLVFKRAGGVCEGCLSAEATDCHHTTYDNMGQEFLFELLALCRDCHRRYHARIFPEFLKRLRTDIIINSGRNQDEPGEMSNG